MQAYANEWPMTQPGRGTLAEPEGWACVGLIKIAMTEGRWNDAGMLLSRCGHAGGPNSPELNKARAEISEAYFRHGRQESAGPPPNYRNRGPSLEEAERISRQYLPPNRQ